MSLPRKNSNFNRSVNSGLISFRADDVFSRQAFSQPRGISKIGRYICFFLKKWYYNEPNSQYITQVSNYEVDHLILHPYTTTEFCVAVNWSNTKTYIFFGEGREPIEFFKSHAPQYIQYYQPLQFFFVRVYSIYHFPNQSENGKNNLILG